MDKCLENEIKLLNVCHLTAKNCIIQLTVGGVLTETGQRVQLTVEEENKPEPELVQTQLQLMVVQIVMGRRLKLRIVTKKPVQVV